MTCFHAQVLLCYCIFARQRAEALWLAGVYRVLPDKTAPHVWTMYSTMQTPLTAHLHRDSVSSPLPSDDAYDL